jgi:uncharacterized protein YbaP (TraB family)
MRHRWSVLPLLLAALLPVSAQQREPPAAGPASPVADADADADVDLDTGDDADTRDDVPNIDTVVVSGILPGPGMWKVRNGGNTLYILGTISPLPRRMEWESAMVEGTIARAQEVLAPPSVTLDSNLGRVRSLMLLPSLLKARRNPDGRTLQESVPQELYARWQPLKARYIGSDRGVERFRPVFAAQELYEAAMRRSGLTQEPVVQRVVGRVAKRHGIPTTPANLKIVIEDPKSLIREFNDVVLADTECFDRTLSRIEGDIDAMRARANAWAQGDIDALRALVRDDQYQACIRALTGTGIAARLGMGDLAQRVRDTWLAGAEAALAKNSVSFGTLSMGLLLPDDGYLAELRAKGYVIEAP